MERTLVLIKPDAVQRGLAGEIITRFERVGLKIVGTKMLRPDYDHYYHHYENIGKVISRRGQEVFDNALDAMNQGPVIAFVLEGIEAVAIVRKLVGETEPKSAAPGTIRGDYSHISFAHANSINVATPNVVHASGDTDEAEQEIAHWFAQEELYDYATTDEHLTRVEKKQ